MSVRVKAEEDSIAVYDEDDTELMRIMVVENARLEAAEWRAFLYKVERRAVQRYKQQSGRTKVHLADGGGTACGVRGLPTSMTADAITCNTCRKSHAFRARFRRARTTPFHWKLKPKRGT